MKKTLCIIVILTFLVLSAYAFQRPGYVICRGYIMVDSTGWPVIINGKYTVVTEQQKLILDAKEDTGDSISWVLIAMSGRR